MLHLLLLALMSVHLVTAQELTDKLEVNITSCPVTIFGTKYESFFVHKNGSAMTFCFDEYHDSASGDCLDISVFPDALFFFSMAGSLYGTLIKGILPDVVTTDLTCGLVWTVEKFFPPVSVYLFPYGDAAVLLIENIIDKLQFTVSGIPVYQTNSTVKDAFMISGCKKPDGGLAAIGEVLEQNNETCSKTVCGSEGIVESRCPPGEVCVNQECKMEKDCVVSGSSIIDVEGKTRHVENFCGHKLLDNSFMSLETFYGERRLSDVPLVEKVLVKVPSLQLNFTLGQGGKIFNQSGFFFTATENGTAVGAATAFKVPGGVLTKVVTEDVTVQVFFDGTTVHIHSEGSASAIQNETGICSNASNVNPADGDAAGCDAVVHDSQGDGIDCDAVKQRCDVLKKEPFANCSVDVEPYISACSHFLCNYTDTDGLFCHLLDAYARVCQLENWMDTVGCSPSGCHEHKCIDDHEFCGLSVGGDPKCFCRSSFAAPFRAEDRLGEDTVCASKSASVSLVGCLLEEKGINISSLHLNDPTCSGVHDPSTNQVTFTFSDADNCAANVSMNGSKIVYSNTIKTAESSGIISREDQLYIQFSCTYVQPQVQTMSLKILDSSVVKVIDAGEWTYVFNMTAFTDETLSSAVDSSTELSLDQELWVQVKASDADEKLLALVIEGCWATEENNPKANVKYDLIKNGCSEDKTVTMVSNGASLESVFSFRVFQFVGSEADVFLHCDTKLCLKSDGCTKVCGGSSD